MPTSTQMGVEHNSTPRDSNRGQHRECKSRQLRGIVCISGYPLHPCSCRENYERSDHNTGVFESAWRPSAAMAARKWLRKGATVEIFADNEWWNAEILAFNREFVRIHYVGGGHPCPSLLVRVYPCVGFSCHSLEKSVRRGPFIPVAASSRCPAAPFMSAHGFQTNMRLQAAHDTHASP